MSKLRDLASKNAHGRPYSAHMKLLEANRRAALLRSHGYANVKVEQYTLRASVSKHTNTLRRSTYWLVTWDRKK